MKKKINIWIIICLGVVLSVGFATQAWADLMREYEEMDELDEGGFYMLHDIESGEELERMNRVCFEDDEIILSDNRRYRVSVIDDEGFKAHCEQIMDYEAPVLAKPVMEQSNLAEAGTKTVAIYATHSDESYVPTSGTESQEGGGDILEVAETIATYLEEEGIEVLHSDNIHDPHDSDAYDRSRETATDLLKSGDVSMIIDVHRDGVPDPEFYENEVDGEQVTQIRLVVGASNENSEENEAFAEQLKAYYDEAKPGLIKSIYIAKGEYNQDLTPHSILLEVGTHTNSLEEAEAGAKIFAEELPGFLQVSSASGDSTAGNTTNAANEDNAGEENADETEQAADNAESQGSIWPIVLIVFVVLAAGAAVYWFTKKDGQR